MTKEDPLPDDNMSIGDEIDAWLKAGAKDQEPPQLTPEQVEKRKELSGKLSEAFISKFFPQMPGSDIRLEAENTHARFSPWKTYAIETVSSSQHPDRDVYLEVAHGFDLLQVATYAYERFDLASREKGRADIGSAQERRFGQQADYWSRVEQIIRSAAEIQ